MFTLTTRMSDALATRPELRQLLPAFHPAFGKLSHPVLGRLLPRLVTVADAARVAGVAPEALLAVMNLPGAAHAPAAPVERLVTPAPVWRSAAVVQRLDVRPQLATGEEPFGVIMAALRALRPGEVLAVTAPFEPAPLIRLMGDRGWRTHGTWIDDAYEASFEAPLGAAGQPADAVPSARLSVGPAGLTLDVRGLEPPEPMRLVLATLDRHPLPLTVLHHREPALLYPRLAERGLRWETVTRPDRVEITIHGA